MTTVVYTSPVVKTYSTLVTDVGAFLHRTDLISRVPNFIAWAEVNLFRELSVKELMTSAEITTASESANMPTSVNSISKVTISFNGTRYDLDYSGVPLSFTDATPAPSCYSFENNAIRIPGAADGTVATVYYTPKIDALSDSNPSNWILENAYDLYLLASTLEGSRYARNFPEVDRLEPLVASKLDAVKRYAERRGQPSMSGMQIKPRRAWTN